MIDDKCNSKFTFISWIGSLDTQKDICTQSTDGDMF
jgi:hypothetical protein